MTVTETAPASDAVASAPNRSQTGLERILGGADHTTLGRAFVLTGLGWFTVAIIARGVVGADMVADNGVLGDWLAVVSNSARVIGPLGLAGALMGVLYVLVPLQLASPAISYPRGAALAFWAWSLAMFIFTVSVAFDGGVGGANTEAARLGNVSLGAILASLSLAAVCVATTVLTHRPPGMGLARVPFSSWAALLGSSLWIITMASAFAHVVVGHVSRANAEGLAQNFVGGILWMSRAPAVYVLAIPILGIALDVTSSVTGTRIRFYGLAQGLVGAFAVLSIGVWAQSDRSINTIVWTLFALGIALPVVGILGLIADSFRRGRFKLTPAVPLVVVSVMFLFGSATAGLLWALNLAGSGTLLGFDTTLLGAAQVTFVGASLVTGVIGAVFHWAPQFWGAEVRSAPALAAAGLTILGGSLLTTVVLVQGLIQRNGERPANQLFGVLVVVAAVTYLLGVLGAFSAIRGTVRAGSDGPPDPEVTGETLEWALPTPARGARIPEDLPEVSSPYPLAPAEESAGEVSR